MGELTDNVPGAMTTKNAFALDAKSNDEAPGKIKKTEKIVVAEEAGTAAGRPEAFNVRKEHIAAEMAKNAQAEIDAKGGAPSPFKP